MPFVYSIDAVGNLQQAIAKDRLTSYLSVTKGDVAQAIRLYERNALLSQGLYGVLQPLEITFRNSLHRVLSRDTGKPNWYDHLHLRFEEIESIRAAKDNLVRWHKTITPGRAVSELTFGFWTKLSNRTYEEDLWVPHLYEAFPHLRKPARATVF